MPAAADIAKSLKEARSSKGLSQAALGKLVGLPQSHISKIESGAVDLQLSSLIELARVLDLDVRLIPRKALPAVDSVVRTIAPTVDAADNARLHADLSRIAEASRKLTRLQLLPPEVERLTEIADLLQQVTIPREAITRVRNAVDQLKSLQLLPFDTENHEALAGRLQDPALRNAIERATQVLKSVRNQIVRNPAVARPAVRAAYTLDDEDDDA